MLSRFLRFNPQPLKVLTHLESPEVLTLRFQEGTVSRNFLKIGSAEVQPLGTDKRCVAVDKRNVRFSHGGLSVCLLLLLLVTELFKAARDVNPRHLRQC